MRQGIGIVARIIALSALIGCGEQAADGDISVAREALVVGTSGVVINEFQAGSSGWVELYNAGAPAVPIGHWQVDDIPNGGTAPKTIAVGASISPGATLVVTYSGFNTASADQVRLVDDAATVVDSHGSI